MSRDTDRHGLPPRPGDDASPAAWRAYADALEQVIAAGEHRGAFLQTRLNQIVTSPAFKVLKKARSILQSTRSSRRKKSAAASYTPDIQGSPLVSILIPFRDQAAVLERCLKSLRAITAYSRYELILIDNGSTETATKKLLANEARNSNTQVLRVDEPFNFSRLNNLAAKKAQGEHLLFLNNDTEIIDPVWLGALLEQSQKTAVGAVGAKLLYPDGRIQHAGVKMGMDDIAGHIHRLCTEDDPAVQTMRECDAVTAACLMTRCGVFEELGGFNETDLPVAYNDVDYCLRVREKNLKIIYTPHARLIHHESLSRGNTNDPRQSAYMCRRWARFILNGK
ncbi:MAG TPA: glycosyltransferase [Planctomycetota bacterium]|nr:glycosyltransferase [Planctomycetota bacterium]